MPMKMPLARPAGLLPAALATALLAAAPVPVSYTHLTLPTNREV